MSDPDQVTTAYDALLAAVASAAYEIGPGKLLTSHWPLVGQHFERGLLVVGQAVYGWIPDWTAADARSPAGRAHILADTKATFNDRDDPMSWISGHRVENSPFWRTCHEVVDALTPDASAPWYSRLAWANLYPVAPNDQKGNPEGMLRECQTEAASAVLDEVVSALRPRLVLVLAGPFVWPFVRPLRLEQLERSRAPFSLVGIRSGTPWIAGMHPGGAQRRGWPARRYAELIVATARELRV